MGFSVPFFTRRRFFKLGDTGAALSLCFRRKSGAVRQMAAVMALGLTGMFTRFNFVARTGLPTILLLRLGYIVSDDIFFKI